MREGNRVKNIVLEKETRDVSGVVWCHRQFIWCRRH